LISTRPSISRLAKSGGANSLVFVIRVLTQLTLVPLFISQWGLALYGEWLLLTAVPAYLVLADFGFVDASSNELARKACGDDQVATKKFYSRFAAYFQRWSLVLALIISLSAFNISFVDLLNLQNFTTSEATLVFLVLAITALISQNSLIMLAGLRAQGKYHWGLFLRAISGAVQLIFVALTLFVFDAAPLDIALLMLLISILAFAAEWSLVFRTDMRQHHSPFSKLSEGESMLTYLGMGCEMMLMPLAQAITIQGSVLLVGAMLGPVTVAIFATHRTLARIIATLVIVLVNPLKAEAGLLQKNADRPELSNILTSVARLTFWLAISVSVVLMFTGSWIVNFWTLGEVAFYSSLFALMLLSVVFESLWRAPSAVRTGSNKHRPIAWGYLLFSLLGLMLAQFLAEDYEIVGVAIGVLFIDVTMTFLAIISLKNILVAPLSKYLVSILYPPIKDIRYVFSYLVRLIRNYKSK